MVVPRSPTRLPTYIPLFPEAIPLATADPWPVVKKAVEIPPIGGIHIKFSCNVSPLGKTTLIVVCPTPE